MTDTVTVQGLDELKKYLNSEHAIKHAIAGLGAAAASIHKIVRTYPPQTAGNAARGFNTIYNTRTGKPINTWYERTSGTKWVRKDGSIGSLNNSENLKGKWTVTQKDRGLTWVIGARSQTHHYFPYVVDRDHQNYWHGVHGWYTVQDVAEQNEKKVVELVKREIMKAFNKPSVI